MSVKFQEDKLNFCDFIQVYIFTTNPHLNDKKLGFILMVSLHCMTLVIYRSRDNHRISVFVFPIGLISQIRNLNTLTINLWL